MIDRISHSSMQRLSDFIASQLGLHYPRERWSDLEQALRSAAPELGLNDEPRFVDRLLARRLTQTETEVLAKHLTVGETYFFREKASLDILEGQILPQLIRSRMEGNKRLRIWSAGCCTGEEPHTIAILLTRLIPDLHDWNVTLIGTDINQRFLQMASEGIYNKWSLRGTPACITERYFKPTRDGRFELSPDIRKMVTFSYLNLVDDCYPSLLTNTNAIDIILCRNVLMYFTGEHAQKVIRNLHHCLIDGGWLLVSPSETSQILSSHLTPVSFPDATLYKKDTNKPPIAQSPGLVPDQEIRKSIGRLYELALSREPQIAQEQTTVDASVAPVEAQESRIGNQEESEYTESTIAFEQGRYPEAAEKLLSLLSRLPDDAKSLALLTHVYANLGRLAEAKELCERAIANDKLLPRYHYLLATILMALGETDRAMKSFKRVLYLDQNFILAHFALGNLTRRQRRFKESKRHYKNALSLLGSCRPEESPPEAEGMTAARLKEFIRSTINTEQDE
ncbi:MAG TPA: chemotaxis protein CheR [Bacteroidetes bacterium]|nr:chemotaxis protein CheR [Bacteroidota bacterium]